MPMREDLGVDARRRRFLFDVLSAAVEGGISSWASVEHYAPSRGTVTVYVNADREDGPGYKVDANTIAAGIRTGTDHGAFTAAVALAIATHGLQGDYDAADADAILQLGLFGQVVYS